MDGLKVQEALKSKGVTLPVIIMTGHGDVALAVRAMKAGAIDFISRRRLCLVQSSKALEGCATLKQDAISRRKRRSGSRR